MGVRFMPMQNCSPSGSRRNLSSKTWSAVSRLNVVSRAFNHLTHVTGTYAREDFVWAEFVAWLERNRVNRANFNRSGSR